MFPMASQDDHPLPGQRWGSHGLLCPPVASCVGHVSLLCAPPGRTWRSHAAGTPTTSDSPYSAAKIAAKTQLQRNYSTIPARGPPLWSSNTSLSPWLTTLQLLQKGCQGGFFGCAGNIVVTSQNLVVAPQTPSNQFNWPSCAVAKRLHNVHSNLLGLVLGIGMPHFFSTQSMCTKCARNRKDRSDTCETAVGQGFLDPLHRMAHSP
jgi:hypothetical protein